MFDAGVELAGLEVTISLLWTESSTVEPPVTHDGTQMLIYFFRPVYLLDNSVEWFILKCKVK
jgi:hypothetical protein